MRGGDAPTARDGDIVARSALTDRIAHSKRKKTMAQGIVRTLLGERRGGANGMIRPTTATGAEVVGQDLFFNGTQVMSLGDDETPLAIGDVVEYRYTQLPLTSGLGAAPRTPVAVEITRLERVPQGNQRAHPTGETTAAAAPSAGPTVEEQMRAHAIYRAI